MTGTNKPGSEDFDRLEKLKIVVDGEVGIVKQLLPGILASGDPPIFSYAGIMADTKAYGAHKCNQRNGGAGFSDVQARVSAIGECLERYCAAFYDLEKLVFAAWVDLGKEAVHPSEWCLFNEKQYELYKSLGWNYEPFTENTKVCWVKGWSLTKEEPRYVPAQMVYIPYSKLFQESIISPSISTGMAFGFSWSEALCYGLYEHFERDAFSICWLWRLPTPNIILDDSFILDLRQKFFPFVSNIWIKYLSLDFKIHVIGIFGLAKIRSTSGERIKAIVMGSAARLDPIRAVCKSFLELGQTAPFYRYLLDSSSTKNFEDDLKNLLNFDDHAYYWLRNTESIMSELSFLESGVQISLKSLPNFGSNNCLDNVKYMVNLLKKEDIEVVAIDLTTPDIEALGGKVCKVLIPSFQPLEGAHLLRHLGGTRLTRVPVNVGYLPDVPSYKMLNPIPHPSP